MKAFVKILVSGMVVSVCFLPWLITLWHQFSRWAGWEAGWSNTIDEVSLNSFKLYLAEWFSSGEEPSAAAVIFGIAVMVFAGVGGLSYIKRKKDYVLCVGIMAAIAVFLFAMGVSVFIVPCFWEDTCFLYPQGYGCLQQSAYQK